MNKSYCPLPFMSLDIEANGEVRPCCLFEAPLVDDNGQVFNLNRNTLDDVLASSSLQQIQRDMIDGKSIKGCRQCYDEEDNGAFSRRLREIRDRPGAHDHLKMLDIKIGHTCNLKCRICNPASSSMINSENKQLGLYHFKDTTDWRWHDKNKLWDQLALHIDAIEQLDLMGGEPFLDRNHFSLLEKLINIGRAKEVELNYVTNGSIYPEHAMEKLFPHFKKVTFTLSADAIGSVYEYARNPAKWQVFSENLAKFKASGHVIVISYSVSAYSLFGIFDALDFYTEQGVKVWFNFVHNIDCTVKLLPMALKEEFENQYKRRFDEKWENTYNDHGVPAIISFMNSAHTYDQNFKDFVKITRIRDKYRKEDFSLIEPLFAKYFDETTNAR